MNAIFFEWTLVMCVWIIGAIVFDRIEWAWRMVKVRRAVERRLGA